MKAILVRGYHGKLKRGRGILKQPVFSVLSEMVGYTEIVPDCKRLTLQVNGIESFWSFTKRQLAKFNGVSVNFELHLKESE